MLHQMLNFIDSLVFNMYQYSGFAWTISCILHILIFKFNYSSLYSSALYQLTPKTFIKQMIEDLPDLNIDEIFSAGRNRELWKELIRTDL